MTKGFKKNPSPWPTAPFIILKFFVALCSVVVLGTMGFFSYHLRKDNHPLPWQFISLAAVAAGTLLSVFAIGVFFCCGALNPILSMVIDAFLLILWGITGGALGKGMAPNLMTTCSTDRWGNSKGVLVCHLYKNVFAFVILGWCFLVGSFTLGAYARNRGGPKYTPAINPKSMNQPTSTAYEPSRKSHYGGKDQESGVEEHNAPYGQGGTYKPHDHGSNPTYHD